MHGWSENLPDFGLGNLATLVQTAAASFVSPKAVFFACTIGS